MIGLRLALGAIAVMAVMTAGMGGLAVLDYQVSAPEHSMVLLTGGHSEYWQALATGAQAAADENGVDLSIAWPPAGETRCGKLSMAGSSGFTATCGYGPGGATQTFHVGEASFGAGRRCAKYVTSLLHDGDDVLLIVDNRCCALPIERLQGFQHAMKFWMGADPQSSQAKSKCIVKHLVTEGERTAAQQIAAAISRHSPRVVVDLRLGAATELAAAVADLSDPPLLVTFDQSEAALELVELGKVAGIIAHDPRLCGYLAVDRLAYFHSAEKLAFPAAGKGQLNVPAVIVRPGEVAEFRASLKQAEAAL
ncbi:substrate-binding domain-containing protein [Lacipirellula sp.]|uniref:substrate-binding domain-containing protein n=1 Tax=Lacipirellula sp. TaxID=2691419 RepID=UPI003D0EAD62